MRHLVRFPPATHPYRATGEEGMYVMVVAPEPAPHPTEDPFHRCYVDVRVQMSRPDVCLSSHHDLWPAEGPEMLDFAVLQNLESQKPATPELERMKNWVAEARGGEAFSTPALASAHLGSSPTALFNPRTGAYWQATVDDLTGPGLTLYEQMEAAYGAVHLLTFLDT